VNLHSLFTGLSGGYVRASRTRNDGTVETSEAGGWVTETIPATQTESWGVPWLKAPLYRGTASTADATTVVLHTALSGSFAPGKQYYVEIAEGQSAGHRMEIDEAASLGEVVVLNMTSPLNTIANLPDLNGELVRIREHWTLNEVFDKNLFHATNNNTTSDRVQTYIAGTSSYSIYWLFLNGGDPKWVLTSDAFLNDQGSRVVPPGEGWFVAPKSVAMNGPLTAYGLVRDHSFRQTLVGPTPPASTATSFVSLGFPMTMSPASNHLLQADGFVSTNNSTTADRFLLWAGDEPVPTAAWRIYWFFANAGTPKWVKDAQLVSQNDAMVFNRHRSFMVTVKSAKPNRVVPRPWTP
jgi:hypothetical protein